jgi:hypothetical protein
MYDLKQMFLAALHGKVETVKKLLASDPGRRQINQFFEKEHTLLFAVLFKMTGIPCTAGHYKCLIELLEADADSFQIQIGKWPNSGMTTPFLIALIDEHLAALRLMLWYKQDYEKSVYKSIDAVTYAGRIDDRDRAEGRYRGFADCLADTARAAREVVARKNKADAFAEGNNLPAAAMEYECIAAIYGEQAKLEETIPYYPYTCSQDEKVKNDPPETYRPVLINYYLEKQKACFERLYVWYQAIDARLSLKADVLTPEAKKYRIEVLDRLLILGGKLHKTGPDNSLALLRLARLKMEAEEAVIASPHGSGKHYDFYDFTG